MAIPLPFFEEQNEKAIWWLKISEMVIHLNKGQPFIVI